MLPDRAAPPTELPRPRRAVVAQRVGALMSFRGRYRVLHLTTLAFFLSFVVWFDFAPFAKQIGRELHLSPAQLVTLSLCNLALTVPARIGIGMLLDRFGPRRVYSAILVFAVVPNTVFATASSFPVLVASRLAVGVVGAGFVVGIRMVAEWFDREEIGTAEGFYGGWGNFGSAAAALALPGLSVLLAGHVGGWRWGIGVAGAVSAVYGVIYYVTAQDTPEGSEYHRPRRQGALEVTSRGSVLGLLALQLPPVAVLGLVAYRIEKVHVISAATFDVVVGVLVLVYLAQAARSLAVNRLALADAYPEQDRYPFRAVVLLSLAYFVTFGTELTVVSLLPTYFAGTFKLGVATAAAAGSAFAFTNLLTRPAGGVFSDMMRRRRTALLVLLLGAVVTFVALSRMTGAWQLWMGVGLVALASVFIQGGNGAVYSMVPLVTRRCGGQVAGMAGAYGNVGGLVFTSILAFNGGDTHMLFLIIAGCAAVMAALTRWLPELSGVTGSTTAANVATAEVGAPDVASPRALV